jgi:hypothetical protein
MKLLQILMFSLLGGPPNNKTLSIGCTGLRDNVEMNMRDLLMSYLAIILAAKDTLALFMHKIYYCYSPEECCSSRHQ